MTDTPPTAPTDTTPPTDELGRRRRVLQLADDVADLVHDVAERAKELHAIGVPSAEWLGVVGHRFGPRIQSGIGWVIPYAAPVLDILLGMSPSEMMERPFDMGVGAGTASVLKSFLSKQTVPERDRISIDAPNADDLEAAAEFAGSILKELAGSPPDEEPPMGSSAVNLARCFLAIDAGAPRMTENGHCRRMREVIGRLFSEAPKMTNPNGSVDATQAPAMDVHILLRGAPMQFSGILSTTPEGTLKLLTPVPGQGQQKPCMIEQFFDYSDVASIALVREVKASAVGSRIITS